MSPAPQHPRDPVRLIDAWLPQTQCTQCGYPKCLDYARAVAAGKAGINRCPPGGEVTIKALARITGQSVQPLDSSIVPFAGRLLARVVERECIGCALCLDACPVDAIVGAAKRMHTVIAAQCSGCALCTPVCPMDCISLDSHPGSPPAGRWPEFGDSEVHRFRDLAERHFARGPRRQRSRPGPAADSAKQDTRQAEIRAAVERVRRRRADRTATGENDAVTSRKPTPAGPHA